MKKSIQVELELISELYSRRGKKRKEFVVVHEARSRLDNLVTKSSTTTTTPLDPNFGLVSFFFSLFFFSSLSLFLSSLEFGPRPDELGTRVKPWRGPAPFEFVTPGIEQHRDRSDGTRYNSFSIPPSELNAAPGEPLEIAWPSGRGEGGGGLGVVIGRFLGFIRVGMESW